jgi:hypothetical protein
MLQESALFPQVTDLSPPSATVALGFSIALKRLLTIPGAEETLEMAVRLDPGFFPASRTLLAYRCPQHMAREELSRALDLCASTQEYNNEAASHNSEGI